MELALNAFLGRTHDAQLIGYTILTAQRNPVRPWTRENVQRTAPGWWAVQGLVEVGNSGGFVQWSVQGQPHIAESSFDPVPAAPVVDVAGLAATVGRVTAANNAPIVTELRTMRGALEDAIAAIKNIDSEAVAAVELSQLRAKLAQSLGIPASLLPAPLSAPMPTVAQMVTAPQAPVSEQVSSGDMVSKSEMKEKLNKVLQRAELRLLAQGGNR